MIYDPILYNLGIGLVIAIPLVLLLLVAHTIYRSKRRFVNSRDLKPKRGGIKYE